MSKMKRQSTPVKTARSVCPSYFLSYSTGEAHIAIFTECLQFVFRDAFILKRTPEALQSDDSQHDVIFKAIQKCAFGVVCLDGLRPNVLFEYGVMRGAKIPVLLFKEENASVDVAHFYGSDAAVKGNLPPRPQIQVGQMFSDIQDRYYAKWNRFQIEATMTTIRQEYEKKKTHIERYVSIPKARMVKT
jgi:hypothetical protein